MKQNAFFIPKTFSIAKEPWEFALTALMLNEHNKSINATVEIQFPQTISWLADGFDKLREQHGELHLSGKIPPNSKKEIAIYRLSHSGPTQTKEVPGQIQIGPLTVESTLTINMFESVEDIDQAAQ